MKNFRVLAVTPSAGTGRRRRARASAGVLVLAASLLAGSGVARANDVTPDTTASGGSKSSGGSGGATTAAPTTAASAEKTTAKSSAAPAKSADHLALGRAAIAATDWKTAIAELTSARAANANDADAANLLGFSYRKSGNLAKAFELYAVALKLNPKHTGALEYQGEAFVEAGQVVKAKANLKMLATLCGNKTCEQYVDLAKYIAKAPKKAAAKK